MVHARRQIPIPGWHTNTDTNTDCDGWPKVYSNTKASPDATAAPVSRRAVGPKSVAVVPSIYAY